MIKLLIRSGTFADKILKKGFQIGIEVIRDYQQLMYKAIFETASDKQRKFLSGRYYFINNQLGRGSI